jgi:hypothetical protein
MKKVVFASTEDCVRSTIAATFFDAFTLPTLVRAIPLSNRDERTPPAVIEAMREVGLFVPAESQVLSAGALQGATLIVKFGDLHTPPALPAEWWDVPLVHGANLDQVRSIRNALRTRVWRLVARNGWYRLQPAQALARRGAHAPS